MGLVRSPNLPIRIVSVADSTPDVEWVDNEELLLHSNRNFQEEALSGVAQRIRTQYGLHQRRLIRKPWESPRADEPSSEDLIFNCVRNLRQSTPNLDFEAFILGSTTSPRYTGSQAAAVLGRDKLTCPAYEIKGGCATSLVALDLAQMLLGSRSFSNVVIACGETLSKVIDPQDPTTWFGLADGAAALWLAYASENPDFVIEQSVYYTVGEMVDLYTVPAKLPPNEWSWNPRDFYIRGDGQALKQAALENYRRLLKLLFPAELPPIQWVIPHQINRSLIREAFAGTTLDSKVIWDADEHGCIGGASILYSLAKVWRDGRVQKGDRILLIATGGGLSCAAQVWIRV